jgi:hypothetical protein
MNKKIVVTGATGLIGKSLVKKLIENQEEVVVLSGNPEKVRSLFGTKVNSVYWDYSFSESLIDSISDADIIIHLAGANVAGKRWSENYKKLILESRRFPTQNLVKAIEKLSKKPESFICSSAVGFYGNTFDDEVTENYPPGKDFLAEVCSIWEEEASKVEKLGVRRVSIRTGIVLSTNGGALKKMLLPFKLFAGGPLGSGEQWFPWIHIDDEVEIFFHIINNKNLHGAINAASPKPVRMSKFSSELGKVLHRPSMFKVPKFVLKIALGEAAESILAGQKIVSEKLLDSGFSFRHPSLNEALKDLITNKK